MRRLMLHCCATESNVFVTQYNTSPGGKNANMNDITNGMNMNTFCWTGSAPGVPCSLYCANIAPAMIAGSTKNGSFEDRSLIQPMKGAWRISTLSSSTQ